MTVKLTFLGAAGTVTGSKYLLSIGDRRILIDCGLFQGFKQLRLRNWAQFPVPPSSIDDVLLTHAHLDHSGYLPLLVRNGFRGPILCTDATRALCGLLLTDSGHLQERDAEFANRHGFSKHKPALPLYTEADAEATLKRFRSVPFQKPLLIAAGLEARFLYAGHILGAAMIELTHGPMKMLFSGISVAPKTLAFSIRSWSRQPTIWFWNQPMVIANTTLAIPRTRSPKPSDARLPAAARSSFQPSR